MRDTPECRFGNGVIVTHGRYSKPHGPCESSPYRTNDFRRYSSDQVVAVAASIDQSTLQKSNVSPTSKEQRNKRIPRRRSIAPSAESDHLTEQSYGVRS